MASVNDDAGLFDDPAPLAATLCFACTSRCCARVTLSSSSEGTSSTAPSVVSLEVMPVGIGHGSARGRLTTHATLTILWQGRRGVEALHTLLHKTSHQRYKTLTMSTLKLRLRVLTGFGGLSALYSGTATGISRRFLKIFPSHCITSSSLISSVVNRELSSLPVYSYP